MRVGLKLRELLPAELCAQLDGAAANLVFRISISSFCGPAASQQM